MKFQVTKGPVVRPHATILTGRSGIGKTYFASTIDARFFICVEQGLSGAHPDLVDDIPRFDHQPQSLGEYFEMLAAFKSQAKAERWRHLVTDSLSGIEALVNKQACGQEKVAHMEAKDFKKVWAAAMPIWQRVQRELDAVRDQTGAHLWLIAHSQETTEVVETGDTFSKYDLAFQGSGKALAEIRQLWRAWADHVFFLDWQASIKKAGSIGQKAVGQYKSRILWTRETPRLFAKSRSAVPETLPATWEDLRKAMAGPAANAGAKVRAQIVALLDQIDGEAQVEIEKALKNAKTPAALAEVLSRAQGMVAVREIEAENGELPNVEPLPPEDDIGELLAEAEVPTLPPPAEPAPALQDEEQSALRAAFEKTRAAFPHALVETNGIYMSTRLDVPAKLAALREIYSREVKAARAGSTSPAEPAQAQKLANDTPPPPPVPDPKVLDHAKRLLVGARHDPDLAAPAEQLVSDYGGRLDALSTADLQTFISELGAFINGRAA